MTPFRAASLAASAPCPIQRWPLDHVLIRCARRNQLGCEDLWESVPEARGLLERWDLLPDGAVNAFTVVLASNLIRREHCQPRYTDATAVPSDSGDGMGTFYRLPCGALQGRPCNPPPRDDDADVDVDDEYEDDCSDVEEEAEDAAAGGRRSGTARSSDGRGGKSGRRSSGGGAGSGRGRGKRQRS